MINNKDSSTILPSNLRTGQEIRIFYCKFRAWQRIIRDNVSLGTPAELVPFWNIFNFTIFELSSQNRNLNSLLCEIFTNLAVKTQKLQTQRIIYYGRQNSFDSLVNQGIHHDTCIFCNCLFQMGTCGYFHFGNHRINSAITIAEFAKNAKCIYLV